jgi:hypothetical protein
MEMVIKSPNGDQVTRSGAGAFATVAQIDDVFQNSGCIRLVNSFDLLGMKKEKVSRKVAGICIDGFFGQPFFHNQIVEILIDELV